MTVRNCKTGNVDAEKAEIVTYYFCVGKEWQGIYFMSRQIIFQSIRKWITSSIQQRFLPPESCAKGLSRGMLQRALLQKQIPVCITQLGCR